MEDKNKRWSKKNFEYKRAAEILKNSGLLKTDLRKELTKYQKQKIRDLYRLNGGALFRMARFKEEAKQRRRLEKLADINGGTKLTPELVKYKVGQALLKNPNGLSKKQLSELNNLYIKNRKAINNNPNNYGLRGFRRVKVTKRNAEILIKNGWVVKDGYAFFPTLAYKTKGFKKDLYLYTFPNGQKFPAIVEHTYKRVGGKEFTYFIQASSTEIVKLTNDLMTSGKTNLYPDLLYTSGSKARENTNAKRVDDIGEFMHYVANTVNGKSSKNSTADTLIESIRIESNTKPKIKY